MSLEIKVEMAWIPGGDFKDIGALAKTKILAEYKPKVTKLLTT